MHLPHMLPANVKYVNAYVCATYLRKIFCPHIRFWQAESNMRKHNYLM